jgi:hypothetical protein
MDLLFRLSMAVLPIWVLVGASGSPLQAQELEPPSQEEIHEARTAPLFASHEVLSLTLEADFHTLKREDRSVDSEEERPAVLRWANPDGSADSLEIQVRTRGNYRLQRRNCEFPPLRINVKKKSTKGTLFDGQDKLKLVVTCKLGQDYWEQYVLMEYGTYRTLNALTDLSFRVRLAQVTYVDTSEEDEPFTRYAFLIEDDEMMALRNGGKRIEWSAGQLDPRLLEHHHAILVDVFQYMIGNTDWSGVEMHNMELFQTFDDIPSTIPFDFDFSGLVNTRYATPDPSLPIRRVRQRLFRGFCPGDMGRDPEEYEAVYELFREKKEEIYDAWRAIEGLERDRLEETLEYFDDFYETLDDAGRIDSRMLRACRRLGG